MQKLNMTDRRGALQYLPFRAFGAAGDNNNNTCVYEYPFIITGEQITWTIKL